MLMQKKKFNVVCILKASITEQWLVFDVEFHMLKSPQKYFSIRFKLQYIKPKGENARKQGTKFISITMSYVFRHGLKRFTPLSADLLFAKWVYFTHPKWVQRG